MPPFLQPRKRFPMSFLTDKYRQRGTMFKEIDKRFSDIFLRDFFVSFGTFLFILFSSMTWQVDSLYSDSLNM